MVHTKALTQMLCLVILALVEGSDAKEEEDTGWQTDIRSGWGEAGPWEPPSYAATVSTARKRKRAAGI